jgi:RNA polymerase sigma-70 factor (ECF subfamily)
MSSALTDAVVDDARRGDSSALTAIYIAVSPGILGYLRSHGSRDPEGLTQEVFVQLLPRIRRITGGASGVRALAFTIAHSRLVDEFRRRGRATEMPYEAELDGRRVEPAESEALDNVNAQQAAALLEALGDDQRSVIMLRVFGDLSLEDTARALGKSVGAVKQLQRRGLLALRAKLDTTQFDTSGETS